MLYYQYDCFYQKINGNLCTALYQPGSGEKEIHIRIKRMKRRRITDSHLNNRFCFTSNKLEN